MNKYTKKYSSDRGIFWIIGIISAVALVLIIIVAVNESKAQVQVASFSTNDASRPKAYIANNFKDVGNMETLDEKTVEFTIENKGGQPLMLYNISSSCGCTVGTVTINGQKSPEFSMHAKSDWIGTLPPTEKAIVALNYKPSSMPVKGEVTRTVYVSTNDPDNKELTFSIKAFVE